jgi:hypothetical protein
MLPDALCPMHYAQSSLLASLQACGLAILSHFTLNKEQTVAVPILFGMKFVICPHRSNLLILLEIKSVPVKG